MVLRDGRTCHLRPIHPDDDARLARFHSQLSAETIYFRFVAPYPELSERDISRFVNVDFHDRVALVATEGGELIAVARFDRLNPRDAEVAFVVRDDHQSRGLGAVLLEHLAAAAWEVGLRRFVAEVLPNNRRMLATFREAGYVISRRKTRHPPPQRRCSASGRPVSTAARRGPWNGCSIRSGSP